MGAGKISKAAHCHVYLIRAETGQVKIGRSVNPRRRISGIQTGSPVRVSLAHSWKLKTAEAVAFERVLHRLLRWARTSGEWHKLDHDLIRAVGDRWLADDHEGADFLVKLLKDEQELHDEWDRLAHLAASRSLNWDKVARREAREDADEAYSDLMDVVDERIALGVMTEAERALERCRARVA